MRKEARGPPRTPRFGAELGRSGPVYFTQRTHMPAVCARSKPMSGHLTPWAVTLGGVTMRLAAVPSAALLLVAASGCSGHAVRTTAQVHLTDPVGDVLLAGSTKSTDAKAKNADIVAADIRRTSRFLQVSVRYHDLASRASRQWGVSFLVATSKGGGYISSIYWERGQWVGSGMVDGKFIHSGDWYQGVSVSKAEAEDNVKPQCPHAATAKVDYPNATLTIRVANRCLDGNPAWMRVDDLETYSKEAAAHGTNDYSDNPFNTTARSESTPHLVAPAG
jgi:hypothetical protein